MSKYFGTDGFRGESNIDLTVDHAFLIGKFLGNYYLKTLKRRPQVVIGKDTRRSSYMFEYAISAGLVSSGADVFLMHVTTTPSVSYVTRTDNFDLGIMISASHNPFYDNGIKLINHQGLKLEKEVLDLIEEYIDCPDKDCHVYQDDIGMVNDYSVGRNRYIGYLMSIPTRSFKNIKVALDCANGASSLIAKSVFDALGAKTFVINNQPNGLNINVDCGSTHIDTLRDYVVKNKLDLGFAYDGDADRCLAVDSTGKIIDGDLILYLSAIYLDDRNELPQHTVVMTIMSNMGILKGLKEKNINCSITDVGDKNVAYCMNENGYSLGGEQSGHVIFSKHATTGDGILTSLKVMEAMLEQKKSLHDLVKGVEIYPQALVNIKVSDKTLFLEDQDIQRQIHTLQEKLSSKGRILVRPSGTEPLIRIMVEAENKELCQKYIKILKDIIDERYGG